MQACSINILHPRACLSIALWRAIILQSALADALLLGVISACGQGLVVRTVIGSPERRLSTAPVRGSGPWENVQELVASGAAPDGLEPSSLPTLAKQ